MGSIPEHKEVKHTNANVSDKICLCKQSYLPVCILMSSTTVLNMDDQRLMPIYPDWICM